MKQFYNLKSLCIIYLRLSFVYFILQLNKAECEDGKISIFKSAQCNFFLTLK